MNKSITIPWRLLFALSLACSFCAARGCEVSGPSSCSTGESTRLTFNRDIAPLVFENCASCHHGGPDAPFDFRSYAEVRKHAVQIGHVVATRFMPPWLPEVGHGNFQNQRRLTDRQIATIQKWIEQGANEGVPADLPTAPQFADDWKLGTPDLIVRLDQPYRLPADGTDVFHNFVIPVPLTSTRYVRALEMRLGDAVYVHHGVAQFDPTPSSRFLDDLTGEPGFPGVSMGEADMPSGFPMIWTPGKIPANQPDIAWRLEPHTDLVLQLHMLPSGKPEQIQPEVGFYFTDRPTKLLATSIMLEATQIDILPGDNNYKVQDEFELAVDVDVIGLFPHAHLLGKSFQSYATLPNGSRVWLLSIPKWNFDWQEEYRYKKPIHLPAGSRLTMEVTYDNSAENLRNPHHPPQRVSLGNSTADEMGNILLQMVVREQEDIDKLHESRIRQLLSRFPEHARANFNLGVILESRGLYDEARQHYERSLLAQPSFFRTHDNLGRVYSSLGQHQRATSHFNAALDLHPENASVYNNWGADLLAQGRWRGAEARLRKSLELWPNFAEAHINLGKALLMQGRQEEAISQFRSALAASPDDPVAHYNLGTACMSQNYDEIARRHLNRAVKLRPGFTQAHNNLGIMFYRQGKHDRATEHFLQVLKLDPDNIDAGHNLRVLRREH